MLVSLLLARRGQLVEIAGVKAGSKGFILHSFLQKKKKKGKPVSSCQALLETPARWRKDRVADKGPKDVNGQQAMASP